MRSFLPTLKKLCLTIALVFCFGAILHAQTIRGHITDAKNGETLIGASVHIENGSFKSNTTVKLDGTYIFKNVPAGTYTLKVSYIGYKSTQEYSVDVTTGNVAILNISNFLNALKSIK